MSDQTILSLEVNKKKTPDNLINHVKHYGEEKITLEHQSIIEYQRFDNGSKNSGCHLGSVSAGIIFVLMSSFFFAFIRMLIECTTVVDGEVLSIYSLIVMIFMTSVAILKGQLFLPGGNYNRILLLLMGILGGLSIFTAKICIEFMPANDAVVIIFTKSLFITILATIFLKDKISALRICSGLLLSETKINR